MATKKPAAKPAPKKAVTAKPAAKAPAKVAVKPVAAPKAITTALNKTTLIAQLVAQSGVDAKAVKAVLAALEATTLASMNKKGIGEFTLPGLLKVVSVKVPAKAKRFGVNPFTKAEQWFPAKPASVKIKVRPLKKLKDVVL
jgi:nucleoid DNA-binding protein